MLPVGNISQTLMDHRHGFNKKYAMHKLFNNPTCGKSKSEESVRTWIEFSYPVSNVFGTPFADLVIFVEYDEFHGVCLERSGRTTCKVT